MKEVYDKPHIAFLISSFRAGGGERVMISLANGFAQRGYQVDLLVLKPVGQYEHHTGADVRVVSLDRKRLVLSLFPLMSYLKKEAPDTVLALDEYTHLLALVARYFTGSQTRIVLRIGNMLSELFLRYEGLKNKILPHLVRRLYRKADAIIAVSKGVRDDVIEVTGIVPERVIVIYQPKPSAEIRVKAAAPVDHPWFTDPATPIVIFVGRLRVQKNIPLLIHAFAQVRATTPARLMLLGSGREEGRIRELIRELKMDQFIELIGYADNPYAYMQRASLFAFPTLWEGMPNALLEAMVVGLPVISSDSSGSGPREILAPTTDHRKRLKAGIEMAEFGILTAVGDETALVEALRKMLTDEVARARYASKSIERSEAFEADDILDQYAQVLAPPL